MNLPQLAVKNALSFYAQSLGVTLAQAVDLYEKNQSTRDAVCLLVLAQADPEKLRNFKF